MAYSGKIGLDYFPMDVGFFEDDKTALIEAEFGPKGVVITLKLLCKVYKEGYFYKWGDDECLLFSRRAGAEIVPGFVKEVVAGLVRRSFFDKWVFDTFQVLTSKGIQKRYFEAAERRKTITVIREYLLIDVSGIKNVNIVGVNANISPPNVDIFRQSKVKESKKKEEESKCAQPSEKLFDSPKDEPETPPPVATAAGFFPTVDNMEMDLPEIKIGMQIQRVRLTRKVDINEDQVLGMWAVFKAEYFTGKKYYEDEDAIFSHFGNWLKDQKFSNGSGTGRQTTVSGSISAANAAFADLQRDLDEAMRGGQENT